MTAPVRVWKDVLHPARQRDAAGRWFGFSRADIARACANVGRMLSRGVPIPCVWEHQDVEAGDGPARLAAYARHTFGWVRDARVGAGGVLELLHEVPDPKDAEQLLKTRFVSPKVYRGYSDSRGGEYRGATVAHVAATPTPVQFWQRPFTLSRRRPLYLSYTPEGRTVADDNDDKPKGGEGEGGAAGGKKTLADVIEALREYGLTIPDEVTDETGLVIAIKASGGGAVDPDDDDLDDDEDAGLPPDAGAGGAVGAGGSAPMVMSDPRAKALLAAERRELVRRANRLFKTGRVTKPTADKLVRQLNAVELSYTRSGDLAANPAVDRLVAYEELPQGSAWAGAGRRKGGRSLSAARPVDPPEQVAPAAPAQADLDFWYHGLPAKK